MPDDTPQPPGSKTPTRSAADKERTRQQSRSVSGREAAKGVGGQTANQRQSGKGQRPAAGNGGQGNRGPAPQKQATKNRPAAPASRAGQRSGGRPSGNGARGGGQRPPRGGTRPAPRPGQRRSPTALLTWGVVALVLIIVIVLVVVKVTGGNSNPQSGPSSQPAPAALVQEVTHIPASVYDKVGVTSPTVAVTPPTVIQGATLTSGGKPEVFYMGGEFCPYCAAERWALIAAYSRFGTLTGLGTMQSSSTDAFPNTQTFTFANAHYTSSYIAFVPKEYYSNQLDSAGTNYTVLQPLTDAEQALVNKYDSGSSSGSSGSGGSIPFVDIANKAIVSGASYTPSILAGLSRSQIAADLSDPNSPVTQAIVSTANYMTAATCAADNQQPGNVCNSSGVQAAAKALKLSS